MLRTLGDLRSINFNLVEDVESGVVGNTVGEFKVIGEVTSFDSSF